ncbi:TetR/AcrR family transcriptional regulator [Tsukamurella pulmonis]|uniref:TetR/AcrR family transcriptional regulator n=1 Tax=Tsukamurella pulmonis TaxID=47312 RepID=UPI000838A560|nr:TetR/AcrR family transcriptional regulator [Tsukamurella pulmonis]RDH10017.1 TetR/AcrR family transcriptional regulator [Tsukamurella pulmonis]
MTIVRQAALVTRTRLDPAERREQILAAARVLYRDRPYETVSTKELADAANVSRSLVNHYFGDKRALFLTVMREAVVMPVTPAPELGDRPLAEAVRGVMDWILDAAATFGQDWVNTSGGVDLHGRSDVQAMVDEADDRAARLVLDAVGLPDDARLRARLRPAAALTKSACREWLQRGTLSRDEVLDILTGTVVHILAPSAGAAPEGS